MHSVASVYVSGISIYTAAILPAGQMQAQNFSRVPWPTIITHKQLQNCQAQFCYHGNHLIVLKQSFKLGFRPMLISTLVWFKFYGLDYTSVWKYSLSFLKQKMKSSDQLQVIPAYS